MAQIDPLAALRHFLLGRLLGWLLGRLLHFPCPCTLVGRQIRCCRIRWKLLHRTTSQVL